MRKRKNTANRTAEREPVIECASPNQTLHWHVRNFYEIAGIGITSDLNRAQS
jgi:hypothetical protein